MAGTGVSVRIHRFLQNTHQNGNESVYVREFAIAKIRGLSELSACVKLVNKAFLQNPLYPLILQSLMTPNLSVQLMTNGPDY